MSAFHQPLPGLPVLDRGWSIGIFGFCNASLTECLSVWFAVFVFIFPVCKSGVWVKALHMLCIPTPALRRASGCRSFMKKWCFHLLVTLINKWKGEGCSGYWLNTALFGYQAKHTPPSWHLDDNTDFTQQQSHLMCQRRSNGDLDRERSLWNRDRVENRDEERSRKAGTRGTSSLLGPGRRKEEQPFLLTAVRYFQYSPNQGPAAHPIYANMLTFKAWFIRIIDLCFLTASGLLVQSPLKVASFRFVDVATLKYQFPLSLLQSEMSAWRMLTSDSIIRSSHFWPVLFLHHLQLLCNWESGLGLGVRSSGLLHLCSLFTPVFKTTLPFVLFTL